MRVARLLVELAHHPLTAIATVLVAAAACTATPATTAEPSTSIAPPAATSAGPDAASASPHPMSISPSAAPSAAPAGSRSTTGQAMGSGTYPDYTLMVPDDWDTSDRHFAIGDGPSARVLGVGVWDVALVAKDPCHSVGNLVDPGPTVDGLVGALTSQVGRNATDPVDVTIAGRPAIYLEWSVPADAEVVGDSDFVGCDEQGNGHLDYVSFTGRGGGERYQQEAGQVDRLWILDVDGQRLLIDATYSSDASQAALDALDSVVQSIRFETP